MSVKKIDFKLVIFLFPNLQAIIKGINEDENALPSHLQNCEIYKRGAVSERNGQLCKIVDT